MKPPPQDEVVIFGQVYHNCKKIVIRFAGKINFSNEPVSDTNHFVLKNNGSIDGFFA